VYSQIDVSNFYIVAKSTKNVEGQGHVVFYMDMDIPVEPGKSAELLPSPAPSGFKGKLFVGDSIEVQDTKS
jgi:hypothetical protein